MANRYTNEEIELIKEMYMNDVKTKDIAEKLGRTISAIKKKITELGLTHIYKRKQYNNIVGRKFNRLTVIEDSGRRDSNGAVIWKCICDCQTNKPEDEIKYTYATHAQLNHNRIKSCGCLQKEHASRLGKSKHKTNKYDLESNCYGIGYTANFNDEFLFDLEDYDKIKDYCWYTHVGKTGYKSVVTSATINGKQQTAIKLHYVVTGIKGLDHHNRNSFDNRKKNLYLSTKQENSRNMSLRKDNTTGITGVSKSKRTGQYEAYISIDKNKKKNLGYFVDFQDAVVARLKAEKEYFGEFAPQRHLFEEYGIF